MSAVSGGKEEQPRDVAFSSFKRVDRLPNYAFESVIRLMSQARARGEDVVDLGMGNPDGSAPERVIQKLVEVAQRSDTHRYSRSVGVLRLRKAICDWYLRRFQVELDPDKEAIATMGSKEGLAHLALACVDAGDTVLVPSPAYPIHTWGMVIAGADVRHIPCGENTDEFLQALETAVEETIPKPVMLVLNFPSNPTGQCVDLNFYERVVACARKWKLWVVQDLAYADIVFEGGTAPSILQVPGAKEVAVESFTLSKSYNMPGWRVGFCCGNAEIIAALARLKSYYDYGIFTPIQIAAVTALDDGDDVVAQVRDRYRSRRDVLCDGLINARWPLEPPKATMFVWAPLPAVLSPLGSVAAAELLLKEAGVAVSPGLGFGIHGEGYVRFSLIENEHRIRQAVRNIRRLLHRLEST